MAMSDSKPQLTELQGKKQVVKKESQKKLELC